MKTACRAAVAVLMSLLAPVLAGSAQGAAFSLPEALPSVGVRPAFAINDLGQGVEAYVSAVSGRCGEEPLPPAGELTIRRITSGRPAGPVETILIPGYFNQGQGEALSVSIDNRGRVVVGFTFEDGSSAGGCEEHGVSCCARAAVVTWRRSADPAALDVLPPPRGAPPYGEGHEALQPLAVALRGPDVVAVWARYFWFERAAIEESAGHFGAPLSTRTVAVTPEGRLSDLRLVGGRSLTAVWEEEGDRAVVHKVPLPQRLHTHAFRAFRLPAFDYPEGLASDARGDVAFVYEPGGGLHRVNPVVVLSAPPGGSFSRPRTIAHVPESEHVLAAGGHGLLLLVWWDFAGRVFAERGGVFGPFERPVYIGKTQASPELRRPGAFIDGRGRAVVVYTRGAERHRKAQVVAVAASPGHRFGPPRTIARSLSGCNLRSEFLSEPAVVTSSDGHALIVLDCGEGARAFAVRYSP